MTDFTKDEILNYLLSIYTGPGSTDEGSFAGDVLRACADAMAELYALQIDGLARRAFVSAACGDDLTAVCADRGIQRLSEESDDALRARALTALAATPASGNADHYAAWCAAVDGILRVQVLPLARGAGTVDILAVGLDGKAASAAVLAAAQTKVDAERPVGVDAKLYAPTETAISVTGVVTLMDGANLTGVKTAFVAALTEFCKENALRTRTISYAKLLRLALECDGVADITGFTLNNGSVSVTLGERAVPVAGTVGFTEVSA